MYVVAMTPTLFSGKSVPDRGQRHVENLARAVAAAGEGSVEVSVFALGSEAATVELAPGVVRTVLPVSASDELTWGIERAVRGAGLVHVHKAFTRFGQAAVLAAGFNDVPVVISDSGVPSLSERARAEICSVVDTVLAFSASGARLVGGATSIVPGGVDAEWFTPATTSTTRDGFAYVGPVRPDKRIERALAALPAGARFVICGEVVDKRYAKELRLLADGCDVEFVTRADDATVRDLYRSVHAVVVVSEHVDRYGDLHRAPEPMGLVVLEAAACGTPAVVSPTGALPEFVVDGQTGSIVEDDDALTDVLRELHTRPGLSTALGDAARSNVLGRWDLPTVGRRTLELYQASIDRRAEEDDQ